jgi:hypothetical protein
LGQEFIGQKSARTMQRSETDLKHSERLF